MIKNDIPVLSGIYKIIAVIIIMVFVISGIIVKSKPALATPFPSPSPSPSPSVNYSSQIQNYSFTYANSVPLVNDMVSNGWNAVYAREGLSGSSLSYKDVPKDPHIWFTPGYGNAQFQASGNLNGLDASDASFMLGADLTSGPFTAGIAAGHISAWGIMNGQGSGSIETGLWQLGAYGFWHASGARIGFQAGYSGGLMSSADNVSGGDMNGSSRASAYTAAVRGGYTFKTQVVNITPILGVSYVHTAISGFTEYGQGQLSNYSMNVGRQERDDLHARFVVRASDRNAWISLGVRRNIWYPGAYAEEQFIETPGESFDTYGIQANPTMGIFGTGLKTDISRHVTLQVSYRRQFGHDVIMNSFWGNMTVRWR